MTPFMLVLGGVALASFLTIMLLIAAAALRRLGDLRRDLGGPWRPGVVERGDADGVLATHRIEQVGRTKGDGHVWFHDRAYTGAVHGGAVRLDHGGLEEVAPTEEAVVWGAPDQARALAEARVDPQEEPVVLAQAKKARGWVRTLTVPLREGDRVWLEPEGARVSAFDPHRWLRSRTRIVAGLVAADLLITAGLTTAYLWPPRWELRAKLAAAAALVVFNLFQLFGKLVADAMRSPERALVRGHWTPR